jgi:hypothetical protein
MDMVHGADHRCGREHTDAGHLLETDSDRVRARYLCELPIDGGDAGFERVDFLDDERDGESEQIRQRDFGVFEDRRHACEHRAGADGNRQTLFAQ